MLLQASSANLIGYEKVDGNPGNRIAKMMMNHSVKAPCENPLELGTTALDPLATCVCTALGIPPMSVKSSKVRVQL